MEANQILPTLNMQTLQEKVNEYAMKGAIESIKEYYSGYNSPFRKAIDEQLQKAPLSRNLDLPDIIALINESLSQEMLKIANTAIAETWIPKVQRFLTREEKEIKFSDFLKSFVECTDSEEYDDCNVSIEEHEKYEWLTVEISNEERSYTLTFHRDHESKKEGIKKYSILSMPRNYGNTDKYQKLKVGDSVLELPLLPDVLSDEFVSYIARVIISKSLFTMDCDGFDEEMFPSHCHCD